MTWRLIAHGRLGWESVRAQLGESMCAWADYSGFQVGRCPETAPPYTHLWAWSSDRNKLFRVRIDDDEGIVGELARQPVGAGSTALDQAAVGIAVEVVERSGFAWGDDARVGPLPPEAQKTVTLYEVVAALPATFIALST